MYERVLYEELTPRAFAQRLAKAPIAYLPLGTLEWHGEHLPLGADGLQARGFFERQSRPAAHFGNPPLRAGPHMLAEHPREVERVAVPDTQGHRRNRKSSH